MCLHFVRVVAAARTSQIICYNDVNNNICLITVICQLFFGKYLFVRERCRRYYVHVFRVGIYLYCYATLQL